tara:strand:- start:53 stop:739 length:687 start_codon:yes stop_codon:yes gene_type:complete
MLENLNLAESPPISIVSIVVNLIVGAIIAIVLKLHYKKFGSTLTNRDEFSNIFSYILLTTVLVISIVKSSLALSLGLVGALSIVRFRTPIKEPEELAYLFLSIAAGLGLGANQTIPTIVSIIIILVVISIIKFNKIKNKSKNIFINLDYEVKDSKTKQNLITQFNKILSSSSEVCDLRRFDIKNNMVEATYLVNFEKSEQLESIVKNLQKEFKGISITYIDQNQIPSI